MNRLARSAPSDSGFATFQTLAVLALIAAASPSFGAADGEMALAGSSVAEAPAKMGDVKVFEFTLPASSYFSPSNSPASSRRSSALNGLGLYAVVFGDSSVDLHANRLESRSETLAAELNGVALPSPIVRSGAHLSADAHSSDVQEGARFKGTRIIIPQLPATQSLLDQLLGVARLSDRWTAKQVAPGVLKVWNPTHPQNSFSLSLETGGDRALAADYALSDGLEKALMADPMPYFAFDSIRFAVGLHGDGISYGYTISAPSQATSPQRPLGASTFSLKDEAAYLKANQILSVDDGAAEKWTRGTLVPALAETYADLAFKHGIWIGEDPGALRIETNSLPMTYGPVRVVIKNLSSAIVDPFTIAARGSTVLTVRPEQTMNSEMKFFDDARTPGSFAALRIAPAIQQLIVFDDNRSTLLGEFLEAFVARARTIAGPAGFELSEESLATLSELKNAQDPSQSLPSRSGWRGRWSRRTGAAAAMGAVVQEVAEKMSAIAASAAAMPAFEKASFSTSQEQQDLLRTVHASIVDGRFVTPTGSAKIPSASSVESGRYVAVAYGRSILLFDAKNHAPIGAAYGILGAQLGGVIHASEALRPSLRSSFRSLRAALCGQFFTLSPLAGR